MTWTVLAYLGDLLRQALDGKTDWAKLAPHVWEAERPKAIRVYRQEERRQSADRKKHRRARRRLGK